MAVGIWAIAILSGESNGGVEVIADICLWEADNILGIYLNLPYVEIEGSSNAGLFRRACNLHCGNARTNNSINARPRDMCALRCVTHESESSRYPVVR